MVARLAWLKSRLLWNGLRADWQRRFGFPITTLALGWGGWFLASRYLETWRGLEPQVAAQFSLWAALGLYVVWVTLPVVIFPLDENLDPAQFALMPVSGPRLIAGLAVSALIAPSVTVLAMTLGANVVAFAGAWVAAVVSGLLLLAILVVSGQAFTTLVSAILRTRRGRDFALLLIVGIGLFAFGGQQLVRNAISRDGLAGAVMSHSLERWAWALPPVAAQRVATEAAAGRAAAALGWALVATAWIAALAWVWSTLLRWMLTTPETKAGPGRARRGKGLAGGRRWSPALVVTRKELRFYLRDPRQRLVWTGAVIFLGLGAASVLVGSGGMSVFRNQPWLPLLAPALVLFIGLPIALNFFGWERNAASFLFVLPVKPRQLILGKNLAAATALGLETAALALLLAWASGSWEVLWVVPGFAVCAIACQLAVGNLVSVIAPLRLPREGTDVFSQATEQGCLAMSAQLISFFVIGLMLVIPSSVAVLTVAFGNPVPAWFATVFAVVWGSVFYLLSLWISGRVLRNRMPEIVNWVQVV
ncbi:MAG TPA: hypothetical protein VIY70_12005 [Acidimicrobiia bacterium]